MVETIIYYEMTDTFNGDANYSWVKRGEIRTKQGEEFSDLAAVRRVKKALGYSGVKCKKEEDGDYIVLRPFGKNIVIFIWFHSFGNASN